MREAINNNPLAQIAVIGVLLVITGIFVMSSMGGGSGGEEATEATTSAVEAPTTEGSTVTAGATPVEAGAASASGLPEAPAPVLPQRVLAAFNANRTVVLMIAKRGGVDDALTTLSVLTGARPMHGVALFVVPVDKISRYAAITQAVEVSQVPALIVLRPKGLDRGVVTASVSYGYQSPESVEQAVVDARYRGRTLSYHP